MKAGKAGKKDGMLGRKFHEEAESASPPAPCSSSSSSGNSFSSEAAKIRPLTGRWAQWFATAAIAFSCFQLVVAAFHPFSSLATRNLHVGFLLLLTFLLYPMSQWARERSDFPWYDLLLALMGFTACAYLWYFENALMLRAGELTTADLMIGSTLIALVFEAGRRILGWPLPLLCAVFLAYALWGQYLPAELSHRGYGVDQVLELLAFGSEGIFGIPTMVSATYIFLFILFGVFLEKAGMIQLFNAIALGFVGHTQGGAAKVSVLSSALMGSISGSGVANVLTTGQFTIPLMKRFGYTPVFAGAVEATSSMGGQIMPPVMGAVAFIMAENLGVPYAEIVKAAVIPALLYYATVFWMVHLEAKRKQLQGLPKEECPNPWQAIRQQWFLLLPLIALVWMLFAGYTPMYAGMTGLALTAILLLGAAVAASLSPSAFRYVFWLGVGLGCATLVRWGITPVLVVIALLILLALACQEGRLALRTIREALIYGAQQALPVGVACALVGVIIGVLTLTGAATMVTGYILEAGRDNLLLALVLTMLCCLVLGMGIPTIPNYIITSSVAAPALLDLGVPLIVSHLFVFYFGIMADLTPPVALAAFAASSLSRASPLATGFKAVSLAIAGFVVPYLAVYDPSLMLQGEPSLSAVFYVVAKALIAIGLWGAAVIGHWLTPLAWWERVVATVAASALVMARPESELVGFVLGVGWGMVHVWRSSQLGAAAGR